MRMLLPLAPNLSQREFIPTHLFSLLKLLHYKFPRHELILSDFNQLPEAIPGINGPVVQTMFEGTMIPCSTYLVQPGWFDIFFPTDFNLLQSIYDHQRVSLPLKKGIRGLSTRSKVWSFTDFMKQHADLSSTAFASGENPMLQFYQNMSFFVSQYKD